ncbi:LysR family transcriptional regulator [Variovorax sp. WS11]|uniref:LysR family transcriptional regulator n=1 Tax=Variovorax sp. WS11 TaxID=1105204 RepID=UPI000D0E1F37|nr:LysR family transcriptional regulator [Variovorax sp. WS11]NDZ17590.1 LysR family transcriptional regulator [Variovorax sp. WS11]PSL82205.1 LysR family transcriptional regulator [Variovorax sp. WS11]
MNVTLRQLRAFVAVAKAASFTEAASRLHITQSALSGLIKELEHVLGVQVIYRSTRKVQLSEVGSEFLPLAVRILQDLDEAFHAIHDLKALKSGVVRVAAPQLMACTLMPEVIAAFNRQYPGVQIRLSDCAVEAVQSKVHSGEVDFGIGPERDVSHEIATHSLFEMPFVAVFPLDHPLGKLKRVTWADLSRYPLISLQGEYTQILSADLHAASGSLTLSPDIEVTFMTTALSMVNAGLGVTTCLPYATSLLDLYGLQTRLLLAPKLSRKFYLLAKKERPLSPAAQGVADFMRGYVTRQKWNSRGRA